MSTALRRRIWLAITDVIACASIFATLYGLLVMACALGPI